VALSERVRSWLATERCLVGAALVRVGVGAIALSYLVGYWAERRLLWGPHAIYPLALRARELPVLRWPSLFAVGSEVAFEALWVATIAVAVAFTLGWRARWLALPFYVLVSSLLARNPMALTGGDALYLAELPFVILLDTGACLSIDAGWRGTPPARERPWTALVHNVAIAGIVGQVCIAYAASGLWKLDGELWRTGTAAYYALRRPEFGLPGVSAVICASPVVVRLITWATLAFEVAYPLLVARRRTRVGAVCVAALFHAAIALVMGLVTFAAEMLVFQAVMVDDDRWRAGFAWLPRAWRVRRAVSARA
jgi:hypothetical protein